MKIRNMFTDLVNLPSFHHHSNKSHFISFDSNNIDIFESNMKQHAQYHKHTHTHTQLVMDHQGGIINCYIDNINWFGTNNWMTTTRNQILNTWSVHTNKQTHQAMFWPQTVESIFGQQTTKQNNDPEKKLKEWFKCSAYVIEN